MTAYNFFTADRLGPSVMAATLAGLLRVPSDAVDVADADGDQEGRNWDAPVLCGYSVVPGDVALALDIYVQDSVAHKPAEADVAVRFATLTGTTVLYPAEEAVPSAYWTATPEGVVTRARLVESDDVPPSYTVEAVEAAVPRFPGARVRQLPEILREERVPTPVTDEFVAVVGSGAVGTDVDRSRTALLLWERMVRRMESDWRPSGRYPVAMYGEDLRTRDQLAQLDAEAPEELRATLHRFVGRLDGVFRKHTVPDDGQMLKDFGDSRIAPEDRDWWWQRRPMQVPWDSA